MRSLVALVLAAVVAAASVAGCGGQAGYARAYAGLYRRQWLE